MKSGLRKVKCTGEGKGEGKGFYSYVLHISKSPTFFFLPILVNPAYDPQIALSLASPKVRQLLATHW